jgi:hypothetical protein
VTLLDAHELDQSVHLQGGAMATRQVTRARTVITAVACAVLTLAGKAGIG